MPRRSIGVRDTVLAEQWVPSCLSDVRQVFKVEEEPDVLVDSLLSHDSEDQVGFEVLPVAALSDNDVVCTRMPPISFSMMTMSPGVISIFSSISSRWSTSTRSGESWMRTSVRVAWTVICSATVSARCNSIWTAHPLPR